MSNIKIANYKSTIELAKQSVALLSQSEQLKRVEIAQEAITSLLSNKLDLTKRNQLLDVYNTINALVSVPGILGGQANEFCIEICEVIKNIIKNQAKNKDYIIPDDDKHAMNMLLDLYMDVIFNVPAKHIRKASDIIHDRLSSDSGVTKI